MRRHTINATRKTLRVLVADDQALYRAGLRSVLVELDDANKITEAGSFATAIAYARDAGPFDLALVGLTMTDKSPLDGLARISQTHLGGVSSGADEPGCGSICVALRQSGPGLIV